MTSAEPPRSAASLITSGPFARFWWAAAIGSTGDWVTLFATIAVADRIAGSAGILVAMIARVLPGLVFAPFVGVITDRVDRRKLIVIADLGRALLVPLLAFATELPFLVLVTIGLELLSLLGQSPRAASVPRLVAPQNIVTANSLLLAAAYGTIPLGAAFNWVLTLLPPLTLGGLIPAQNADFAMAFFVNSATFVISAALVASLPALRTSRAEREETGGKRAGWRETTTDLAEGARFLWSEARVRRIIVAMTTALFGGGLVIVLGKSFVEDVLNADVSGFFAIVTALAFGALAGIAVVSVYSDRLVHRDVTFGVATVAAGLGLSSSAMTDTVFGASAWMVVMGFGAGAAYVMGLSYLHEVVADDLRGRVFATLFALMRVGLFVSMAVAVPLEGLFARLGSGFLFDDEIRSVLFFGGVVIMAAGDTVVWVLRGVIVRPKVGEEARSLLEEAGRALRFRRSRVEDEDKDS
jgi:dTMP kinase